MQVKIIQTRVFCLCISTSLNSKATTEPPKVSIFSRLGKQQVEPPTPEIPSSQPTVGATSYLYNEFMLYPIHHSIGIYIIRFGY